MTRLSRNEELKENPVVEQGNGTMLSGNIPTFSRGDNRLIKILGQTQKGGGREQYWYGFSAISIRKM